MARLARFLFLQLVVLLATSVGHAAPITPEINQPVVDYVRVLSGPARARLTQRIYDHRQAHGTQIAIVIIDSTDGAPIEDYSYRAARRWGGGATKRDDGVLFTLAIDDRRMRIEVGYGLEEHIPDARAKRILARAVPHLRGGDHESAVRVVLDRIIERTRKEFDPKEERRRITAAAQRHRDMQLGTIVLYIVLLPLGVALGRRAKNLAAAKQSELIGSDEPPIGGSLSSMLNAKEKALLALFMLGLPTLLGLLGFTFMLYPPAIFGVMAGWSLLEGPPFEYAVYFVVMILGAGLLGALAGMSGHDSLPVGLITTAVGQAVVTGFFRMNRTPGLWSDTGFSSSSLSNFSSNSTSSSSWQSSSSSSYSYEPSTFSSSSSSSYSSSSSGSSTDWSGGGGGFGGGGASSSW